MTITFSAPSDPLNVGDVYPPQHDSLLLIDALKQSGLVAGRRVLDLCTGSGVVAIAAAAMDAASVTAFDICPHAVRSSRTNAAHAGVDVDVREGSWAVALEDDPFDLVVANPPYVPTPSGADDMAVPRSAGPARAWNAGRDGRAVLDPLCASVAALLTGGGSLLVVHSDLSGVGRSLKLLRISGLHAYVVDVQRIPFGPVLSARSGWLERTGQIESGCRTEDLVVIRADKP